ncbi:DUF917 domain-containing protein [Nonomuraea spiralis]|uniref:DUF917 domain-containing protein n=1 Tax=Nonomuraea spiralis TaxID=46182 RepID=A0ABV5IMW8_9ACTN|nr:MULTISPECIES: DUF917 domain-containing protein [Nonomuraea]RSN02523.1 DUF917 domain-containing protein [Nonomuraea sp. WAC 01424]GGT27331.1 hypothetical protein GCM10010176_084920 [Nonomuraea spiralis]
MDIDTGLLPAFARGCAVLGSGGGGPVTIARAAALQALEDHGPVRVVQPAELDPALLVMPVGTAGSSAVMSERVGGTDEPVYLRDKIEELYGARVGAVLASEIGGANGCLAVAWAARVGLPLVDADGMSRAFPRMDQTVMQLRGIAPTPAVLCDERGRTVVVDHVTGGWLERLVRASLEAFGGQVATSEYIMRGDQVAASTALGSVTRAVRLGTRLPDPLVTGKVAETAGSILVEGLGADQGRLVRIQAASEFVAVVEDGVPLAVVPDVIAMLDTRTGEVVQAEQVRYGLRVSVVRVPCDPVWHTPEGLELAGPAAFGLTGLTPPPPAPATPVTTESPAGTGLSPSPTGSGERPEAGT